MKISRVAFDRGFLIRVSTIALLLGASGGAAAQQASQTNDTLETVVVSGTRLEVNGFEAPTPTTVLSTDDIQATALPNIADVLNQMPQFLGSLTPSGNNQNASTGFTGQNILSLRDLGSFSNGVGSPSRTLVLMDGIRVVPTGPYGTTDINNLPSQLVERIDVVNGGASAAYGSDAIAGAVNFILNTKFTGFKGEINGGDSNYHDDAEFGGSLTYGTDLLDDKAHLLVSVSVHQAQGVPDVQARPWYKQIEQISNPAFVSEAVTPNIPALVTYPNAQLIATQGGLITSGPLKGTEFGPGGSPSQFVYGSPVSGNQMVGGQHDDLNTEALVTGLTNATAFTYMNYDFSDSLTGFVQFNYGYSHSRGNGLPNTTISGGSVTILANNPYVPSTLRAAMTAMALPSFKITSLFGDLGIDYTDDFRESAQSTVGLKGKLGGSWTWSADYQYGQSDLWQSLRNQYNIPKMTEASTVIAGPNGTPVCSDYLTNPACVPIDVLGTGVATPQAISYVTGNAYRTVHYVQQVAEASIQGEPFSTWAGGVPVVFGAGYRSEDTSTPYVDPGSLASQWSIGNFSPVAGSYNLWELFGEADVPLAKDESWAKAADVDLAGRMTDYSTSGLIETWKVGLNYRPIQDILVRGNTTFDIRSPSLAELYGGGSTTRTPETDPANGNASVTATLFNQGDLALTPEESHSYGVGAVYSPSWFAGFSASVDYWQYNIDHAITPIGASTAIADCNSGVVPALCSRITRGSGPETLINGTTVTLPNALLQVVVAPANVAQITATGVDFEVGYSKDLSEWVPSWDADINIRAFATHNMSNIINNGSGTRTEYAGEMGGVGSPSVPLWQTNVSASYIQGAWTPSITWRLISAGVLDNQFYINSSGPLSVDDNYVPSVSYVDLGLSYKFKVETSDVELYTRITNVFNEDPPVIAATFNSQQINGAVYDVIGRYYRVGIRFLIP